MYIAPGQGQTTHWGQMLMSTESHYHFAHLLQVLKQSLHVFFFFLFFFFMFFHRYITPGRGRQTPGVKILMSKERPYHFDHLLQVLKKSLWTLILYTFFNVFFFSRVYSPGQGADNALGSKCWSQQQGFITWTICWPFVANVKKISFNSDFIHIFK